MYQRFKEEQKKATAKMLSWRYVALGMVTTLFITVLLVWVGFFTYSYMQYSAAAQIHSDMEQINKLLITIDKKCSLVDTLHNPQEITFFNRKDIDEKSGLIVRYPERWSGPYSEQDFSYGGKPYSLLKKSSYMLIIPSCGTTLPSGAVIGNDISIDRSVTYSEFTGDERMTHQGISLFYEVHGCHFSGKENTKTTPTQVQELSETLSEFHSALSFAKNEAYKNDTSGA